MFIYPLRIFRNMFELQFGGARISVGLIVVGMQNGFVAKESKG
jgi:hypothetical protein